MRTVKVFIEATATIDADENASIVAETIALFGARDRSYAVVIDDCRYEDRRSGAVPPSDINRAIHYHRQKKAQEIVLEEG